MINGKIIGILALFVLICLNFSSIGYSEKNIINNRNPDSHTIFIFGFFPKLNDTNISYLAINPMHQENISVKRFMGFWGRLFIIGFYTKLMPVASFLYEPMEDKLRVIGNPVYFCDNSYDPDHLIKEKWWQFDESNRWIKAENPSHIFNKSGNLNVSYRIIGDCGLNNTRTKRIRVYERLPKFQCQMNPSERWLKIVGYSCVGSGIYYDWVDFKNIGNGSCIIPSEGHPDIGDFILNCEGEIIIQYVPNGVISCNWYFD